MANELIYGNTTYQDLVRERPFGWGIINPPVINHFRFEAQNPHVLLGWVLTNYKLAYYAGVFYIVSIFGLQHWMKTRPAFDLQRPLLYWNGFLGVFSVFAFARMLPSFLYTLSQPNGLYTSVCVREGMDIPMAFWGYVFAWSKFVELGDTLFTVFRKRPLAFLHYFHHVVTMVVVWTVASLLEPVSRWYCVINTGVHAVMYPYLCMKAAGVTVPTFMSKFITTIQFLEMLVGLGVNLISMYMYESGYECYRHPFSIKTFGVLYASFVLLFGKLFYDNVLVGRKHKKTD